MVKTQRGKKKKKDEMGPPPESRGPKLDVGGQKLKTLYKGDNDDMREGGVAIPLHLSGLGEEEEAGGTTHLRLCRRNQRGQLQREQMRKQKAGGFDVDCV